MGSLLPLFFFILNFQCDGEKLSFSKKPLPNQKSKTFVELMPLAGADLVVGFPDSNEVRIIKGNYYLDGRIIIVNNGTLILDTCQFDHKGDLYIFNNGRMTVRGGRYNVLQDYIYQYGGLVMHNGELNLQNTTISFNGQSWGPGFLDSARFNIRDVTLINGFMTTALQNRTRLDAYNMNIAGEYVIADSSYARFNKLGFVLIWFFFPDSSRVDLRFPKSDSSHLVHWEIKPGSPGVQGIYFTTIVDSSDNVNWGAFPLQGSDVKIRDSRLRATGLLIQGADTHDVNGLINNTTYYNYTLPLSDRNYYLDSTRVITWNLYTYDSVSLNIRNSVFGEMIAWGEPHVLIENSICDGSGGYLGAFDSSQVITYRTTVTTQTISGIHGLFIGVESNFRYGEINAARQSMMVFMNSFYELRPIANDTSFIYIGLVNSPPNPTIDKIIPITGTASIINGPFNPVTFHYYRLLYGPGQNPSQWFQIGSIHYTPVENDTLEYWDTHGLSVGWYALRLTIKNTNGDTIDVNRLVFLTAPGVEEELVDPAVLSFKIKSPNPVKKKVEIIYSLPEDMDVAIEIYNSMGRKVKTLAAGQERPGIKRLIWRGVDQSGREVPAGVYFCRFRANNEQFRKKLILLKD